MSASPCQCGFTWKALLLLKQLSCVWHHVGIILQTVSFGALNNFVTDAPEIQAQTIQPLSVTLRCF